MSYISGNVTFAGSSVNCSTQTGQINGGAYFRGTSVNCGIVEYGNFFDNSKNIGVAYLSDFSGSSINSGIILESASFYGVTSSNLGRITGNANFYCYTRNQNGGTINGNVSFFCESKNIGVISGNAIFRGFSSNSYTYISGCTRCGTIYGHACFFDIAYSSTLICGTGCFFDSAHNNGWICGIGCFSQNAENCDDVRGDAVFADNSINRSNVWGCALFATGARNCGTVNGGTGLYIPPYTGSDIPTNWTNFSTRNWFCRLNWFNSDYTENITRYPSSSTYVVMSGNCAASTLLSCDLWVKPSSINTTLITDPSGIYFYSATGYVLSGINISGNVTFGLNTTLI